MMTGLHIGTSTVLKKASVASGQTSSAKSRTSPVSTGDLAADGKWLRLESDKPRKCDYCILWTRSFAWLAIGILILLALAFVVSGELFPWGASGRYQKRTISTFRQQILDSFQEDFPPSGAKDRGVGSGWQPVSCPRAPHSIDHRCIPHFTVGFGDC